MYPFYRFCGGTLSSYINRRCLQPFFMRPYSCLGCKRFKDVKLINLIPRFCTFFKESSPRVGESHQFGDAYRLNYLSIVAKKLHRKLKLPQMRTDLSVAGSADRQTRSDEFKQGCELVKKIYTNPLKVVLTGQSEADFVTNCEKMSNRELKQLLQFCLKCFTENEVWPQHQAKHFFYLLEREMCRRLNSCFQEGFPQTKEVLEFFEEILNIMLDKEVGYNCFLTYIWYIQYCSVSSISMKNISLLLLSMIRVSYTSQMIFAFLEDFILRNFDSMDLDKLSLFCTTASICSNSINSYKLLDLLAEQLLQSYEADSTPYSYRNSQLNILKVLRDSGFFTLSFYRSLETCLQKQNTIGLCNSISELVQILNTYRTARILPEALLQSSAERCKHLISQGRRIRLIDIGFLVVILGYFQYKDTTDNDIYMYCADTIIKLTNLHRHPTMHTANYLTSCATGLVYAEKFHAGVFDALFGIPNIGNLMQDSRKSELLMIDGTLRIQHPEYTGRLLKEEERKHLQKLVDEQWSLEQEIELTRDLELNVNILKTLVGENNVRVGCILSHFKSVDIMLYIDEQNMVVPPKLSKKSVAVQVIGYNQCISGSDILLGKFALKHRQLAHMGYKIVAVYPSERKQVIRYGSSMDKLEFWINKLESNGIKLDSRQSQLRLALGGSAEEWDQEAFLSNEDSLKNSYI